MPITLAQYETIQRYLDGTMAPQEEKEFLAALNKDGTLKESLQFEKELREKLALIEGKKDVFEKAGDFDKFHENTAPSVKSLIEEAGNEWEKEHRKFPGIVETVTKNKGYPRKARLVNIKLWSVISAVACCILAVVSLELFNPKPTAPSPVVAKNDTSTGKKNSNFTQALPADTSKSGNTGITKFSADALFKKYYRKDTANIPMPDLLAMVPADYLRGDYSYRDELNLEKMPNTRASLTDINSKQNVLQAGHYYNGLSYIETNDKKKAIENLQWVIDSSVSELMKIKARWYAGLVYLSENNVRKAFPFFLSISRSSWGNPYQKYAEEILTILKEESGNQ